MARSSSVTTTPCTRLARGRRHSATTGPAATRSGPGTNDIKGAILGTLYAIAELERRGDVGPVWFALVPDEEIANTQTTGRIAIPLAQQGRVALVIECGEGDTGDLKVERAGVARYKFPVDGNTSVDTIASVLCDLDALNDRSSGTVVTAKLRSDKEAINIVPGMCEFRLQQIPLAKPNGCVRRLPLSSCQTTPS